MNNIYSSILAYCAPAIWMYIVETQKLQLQNAAINSNITIKSNSKILVSHSCFTYQVKRSQLLVGMCRTCHTCSSSCPTLPLHSWIMCQLHHSMRTIHSAYMPCKKFLHAYPALKANVIYLRAVTKKKKKSWNLMWTCFSWWMHLVWKSSLSRMHAWAFYHPNLSSCGTLYRILCTYSVST